MNKSTKRKYKKMMLVLLMIFIPFISIGYSALSTTLNINSDVLIPGIPTLYNVLKTAGDKGVYAKKYTGSHQDSINASLSTEDIYYWYAADDTAGNEIRDKFNVVFAGMCWQMIRTTDTGGVRLLYNGEPTIEENAGVVTYDCSDTRPNHISSFLYTSTTSLSGNYYYSNQYTTSVSGTTTTYTLTNPTQVNVTSSNAETQIGTIAAEYPYTCKKTTATGTCTTLYKVDSQSSGTSAYVYQSTYRDALGTSKFNDSTISGVGYMHNNKYLISSQTQSKSITMLTSTTLNSSTLTTHGNYYYSDSYITDLNGHYSLVNGVVGNTIMNYPSSWVGKYTVGSTNSSYSATSIYYISGIDTSGTNPIMYSASLSNGSGINDKSYKYLFGSGITDNGDGTFTLTGNVEEVNKKDWYNKYSSMTNKFVCLPGYYTYNSGTGANTCSDTRTTSKVDAIGYVTATTVTNFTYRPMYKYGYGIESYNDNYKLVGNNNEEGALQYVYDWSNTSTSNCFTGNSKISSCGYQSLSKSHYTCYNLSGVCKDYNYVFYATSTYPYSVTITGGKYANTDLTNTNNILYDALYASDVNKYDSTIKGKIDEWYQDKLLAGYNTYIDDTIYCNDRTVTTVGENWNPNGGSTTISNNLIFKENIPTGDLICTNITDKFSASNNSAKLTYKVGLISAPEMNLLNNNNVRKNTNTYYTISPNYNDSSLFFNTILSGGIISTSHITNSIRPVISLIEGIEYITGDGSMTNPYVVDLPVTTNTLMKHNGGIGSTFGKAISRDIFESITTVNNKTVPSNAIDSWDVSETQNGSVMAWYKDDDSNGKYELYIGQDGGVIANPNSSYAFSNFKNVTTIDLSNYITSLVGNMKYMFYNTGYNAASFNITGLNNFNTSKVKDMQKMFNNTGYSATTWSIGDLSDWDTSNVTNMAFMFSYAGYKSQTFNLDINTWNTSSVTNMESMFSYAGYNATTFNLDLSDWDTSSVTTMNQMFTSAGRSATTWGIGNLSNWDTSSVTNMPVMFYNAGRSATTFNIDLSDWDTSSVTNMYGMFNRAGYSATSWSIGDLSNWDTSSVTTMENMFSGAGYSATTWSIGNISNWDTSSVTIMHAMFSDAGYSATTWSIGNISNWDTSNVKYMHSMFSEAGRSATTWSIGNLSNWDTSSVTNMYGMFNRAGYSATSWSIGDLSNWDTSSVTTMESMFSLAGYKASTFYLDLSSWDVSNVTNMQSMLNAAGYSATTWNIGNISNWNTSNVTNMSSMFFRAGYSISTFGLDLSSWNTSRVTNMETMFRQAGYSATTWSIGDLSNWDTSNVTDMSSMFSSAGYNSTTFNLDIGNWDTSSVITMDNMFNRAGYSASTWNIGDLSNWDTSSVTAMNQMFVDAGYSASTFILDLSDWDTSSVTSMENMFSSAGRSASTWSIGDLSNWDTSSVTNMYGMFTLTGYSSTTWSIGNLSNWDTSNVTNMTSMFQDAGRSASTWNIGDLSNWDTSKVTTMNQMFYYAGSNATTFNSIGTLKVYDASITNMFTYSKKAKATLSIYSNPTTYTGAFNNAATDSSALITVNYSSTTTNIDYIIATKSSNSNVVKGSLLQ
ncbi:MAG: BspA family leucine-rich repeat surface protein [Bacilli bacterium]|nr:BspA family leucine-rich repeat surface protein [Bacilli bacterium]